MEAAAYLDALAASLGAEPTVQQALHTARDAFQQRLWHELGEALLVAIRSDAVRTAGTDLHQFVLLPCRVDISPYVYAQVLFAITMYGGEAPAKGLELLDSAYAAISAQGTERAVVQGAKCLLCVRALVLMHTEATVEARRILDDVHAYCKTQQAHDLDPVLAALLARAQVRECELLREFTRYYDTAFDCHASSLRADLVVLAEDLGVMAYKTVVAALLSPTVFNFGRLLTYTPFVDALAASGDQWLVEWATLCNDGDVTGYQNFIAAHGDDIATIPDLASVAATTLAQKVRLMALLHLVFFTPADGRVFPLSTIAQRCLLPAEDVEPLLITAFAANIIRGHVDGVSEEVHVTWVQPRVLSTPEILALADMFGDWKKKVTGAKEHLDTLAEQITV